MEPQGFTAFKDWRPIILRDVMLIPTFIGWRAPHDSEDRVRDGRAQDALVCAYGRNTEARSFIPHEVVCMVPINTGRGTPG